MRVTAHLVGPQPDIVESYLPCGFDMPNANGEVTGLLQIEKLGILASPICLTNTSSVGMVYDALLAQLPNDDLPPVEPVVGETWDAWLNDAEGRHVRHEHVAAALKTAASGPVAEGSVGGMACSATMSSDRDLSPCAIFWQTSRLRIPVWF